jgi:DNA-binding MarR family transcriptional regulator
MDEFNNRSNEIKIGMLMGKIGRLHSTRADKFMERIGLFRGQAILLMILSDQDGVTHSELAKKLEISPAAATKVIKRMEELHYLRRRPDPVDERVSHVFLEDEGWAMIHQIRNAFQQIDQVLVSDLTPEEQDTLFNLLSRMYTSLSEKAANEEGEHPVNNPPAE